MFFASDLTGESRESMSQRAALSGPHWIYTLQKLHTMSGNEKLQKHTSLH